MQTTSTASPRSLGILIALLSACGSAETTAPSTRSLGEPTERAAPVGEVASPTPAPASLPASPSTPAQPPASRDDSSDGSMRLVAATFTHGVEARRPVDEVRTFAVGERATVHLVVENLGAAREVTVEWTRGETVLGRTTLEIGTSRAWRTWATRRVTARDVDGGVRARVLDADGAVLTVLEAPVATGAATPAA